MGIEQIGGQGSIPVPASNGQTASRSAAPVAADGGAVPAPTPQSQSVPDLKQVQEAMQRMQEAVQAYNSTLEFSLDKGSGEMVVKVVDSQTNEVIRQIPSKEMLALAQAIDQQLQGLLLKQKA